MTFQQAFFDELEKLAIDPATITAASTGTLAVLGLGSKGYQTARALGKRYSKWRKRKNKKAGLKTLITRAPIAAIDETAAHFGK